MANDSDKLLAVGWHKITFSLNDIARGRHGALQDEFWPRLIVAGSPLDAVLFMSTDPTSNDYFFSPGAVQIAEPLIAKYSGVECSAPARSDVRPLGMAGDLDGISFSNS